MTNQTDVLGYFHDFGADFVREMVCAGSALPGIVENTPQKGIFLIKNRFELYLLD